jgi:hypothetical protein
MTIDVDAVRRDARALLERNTRHGVRDGRPYVFTVPSVTSYPFQWFWDSCFHAIAWAHFDVHRAAEEIRALLAWQRPDGFIPHVIFWDREHAMRKPWHWLESRPWLAVPWLPVTLGKPGTSEMMQPPVLAQAVERTYDAGAGDEFLREAVPRVLHYHRWLLEARDPDGDGLISIIAPSESGLDFSPAYDAALGLPRDPGPRRLEAAMRLVTLRNKARGYRLERILHERGFAVEDVLVNACMVQGLASLARLAGLTGDDAGRRWAEGHAGRSLAALLERSWDADQATFWNLDGAYERIGAVHTIEGLMPLMLRALPADVAEAVVEQHLLRPDRFWPRYPVPSVALCEREFRADSRPGGRERIWRGGTWVNTNWFLVHGLRQHGYREVADAIRRATLELVAAHGFREYFNPISGEPGGAQGFGWSTLVVDM